MQPDQGDECLEAIRNVLRDPAKKKAFVDAQRERWGWFGMSYRQAHARVDQMLEPEDRHFLDVRCLADVIRIGGDASFLDPLLALEAKVLRQGRREMRKAEPAPARRIA